MTTPIHTVDAFASAPFRGNPAAVCLLAAARAAARAVGDGPSRRERAVAPDFARLKQVAARGVIVTSRASTPGVDFVSRFFAPAAGVDEDPVTGSAHCALAPFWRERLGRDELAGFQASARGGRVGVRVAGERVVLSGRAVTVVRGELLER